MKVLFILHYPPPIHGAAMVGKYIKESRLINQGLKAKYINLSTSVSVDEIGKGGLRKWSRYFSILFQSFWQGLFWRPELVYITLSSHGLGLIKDSLVVLICRILGLSHVFHFHNKGVRSYSKTKLGKLIYSFVFKKAKVILLSPLLYSDIAEYVPESRVCYCANGIPDFGLGNRKKKEIFYQPIRLLFLSNLIKSKGILDLLEACKLLNENQVSFTCAIAGGEGDISKSELLELVMESGISQEVTYVGKVSGENKIKVLKEADILTHPTHEDCFPLVLLEAMQVGLPIISTYEGAIPEIVEDGKTGLLVPAKSSIDLADAIRNFFENPELRHRMGNAGKEKFQREYTLEKFEDRFLKILKGII